MDDFDAILGINTSKLAETLRELWRRTAKAEERVGELENDTRGMSRDIVSNTMAIEALKKENASLAHRNGNLTNRVISIEQKLAGIIGEVRDCQKAISHGPSRFDMEKLAADLQALKDSTTQAIGDNREKIAGLDDYLSHLNLDVEVEQKAMRVVVMLEDDRRPSEGGRARITTERPNVKTTPGRPREVSPSTFSKVDGRTKQISYEAVEGGTSPADTLAEAAPEEHDVTVEGQFRCISCERFAGGIQPTAQELRAGVAAGTIKFTCDKCGTSRAPAGVSSATVSVASIHGSRDPGATYIDGPSAAVDVPARVARATAGRGPRAVNLGAPRDR